MFVLCSPAFHLFRLEPSNFFGYCYIHSPLLLIHSLFLFSWFSLSLNYPCRYTPPPLFIPEYIHPSFFQENTNLFNCFCNVIDAPLCSCQCGMHNITDPFCLKDNPHEYGIQYILLGWTNGDALIWVLKNTMYYRLITPTQGFKYQSTIVIWDATSRFFNCLWFIVLSTNAKKPQRDCDRDLYLKSCISHTTRVADATIGAHIAHPSLIRLSQFHLRRII